MNHHHQKIDDHHDHDDLLLISQLYTNNIYTPMIPQVPQQGESKPPRRRRRRKNKEDVAAAAAGAIEGMESSNGWFRKRKLSDEQVRLLEISFGDEHKLESERKDRLAAELGLDPRQVAVWFQNRRARWKNKRLEEEYSKLKNAHENVVVEKCKLDSEVLHLKEQLYDAEREIQRLAEKVQGGLNNSPISSSVSVEANQTPFFGDYNVDGDVNGGDFPYGNLFYPSPEYIDGIDQWMSPYM